MLQQSQLMPGLGPCRFLLLAFLTRAGEQDLSVDATGKVFSGIRERERGPVCKRKETGDALSLMIHPAYKRNSYLSSSRICSALP